MDMATFCLWRGRADTVWSVVLPANGRVSPEQDGSAELLGMQAEEIEGVPGTN